MKKKPIKLEPINHPNAHLQSLISPSYANFETGELKNSTLSLICYRYGIPYSTPIETGKPLTFCQPLVNKPK